MTDLGEHGRSTATRFPLPPAIDQEVRVTFRYPVRFTRDLFGPENPILRDVVSREVARPLLFAIDAGVIAHHPALVEDIRIYCATHRLERAGEPLVVPGGEQVKQDPAIVDEVRDAIDTHRVCRHSYVVAIGGGAVLDMVGFAAATAHRGVRLVRVPTTVLAQNDSAVGVKNGINAYGKKNFLGSFAPPWAVLCDFDFLATLSDRDWRAGISEAVKVALVKDAAFFEWMEDHADLLAARDPEAMAWLIHRCAQLHLEHIATSGDPFELGSSRPLDFGHWAAHKLEHLSAYELRHGEAVSIGIALDATYAHLAGMLPQADWLRILALLSAVGLPLDAPELLLESEGRRLVLAGRDEFREHLGGRLTVMLLERIGTGREVHHLDDRALLAAVDLLIHRGEETGRVTSSGQLPARAA